MKKAERIKYLLDSLCVYDFEESEIFDSLYDLLHADGEETVLMQSTFYKALGNTPLKEYVSKEILANDNIFTKACCAGCEKDLPQGFIAAVKSDLKKLEEISGLTAKDITDVTDDSEVKEILMTMPRWETGEALAPLADGWDECVCQLAQYHRENGYGIYAQNIAFTWRDEELVPVNTIDPVTLGCLKNYESQRQRVIDNTENFLAGHPANNVLLYGDRGTGKSSTVHALLNEYHSRGLRMIEIPKSAVADLTLIRERIADSPMKFIIYIDDLSFDSNDDSFSELKAALEGSLSGKREHTLIYATSNRRHLIRESFSDRENDVNRNDIMQEQLSLSDRFGLTITFLNPGRQEYLDIVRKIAADRELGDIDEERLCLRADQWASRRGGRSPRCAKQFIDHIEGCIKSGKNW